MNRRGTTFIMHLMHISLSLNAGYGGAYLSNYGLTRVSPRLLTPTCPSDGSASRLRSYLPQCFTLNRLPASGRFSLAGTAAYSSSSLPFPSLCFLNEKLLLYRNKGSKHALIIIAFKGVVKTVCDVLEKIHTFSSPVQQARRASLTWEARFFPTRIIASLSI